MFLCLMGLLAGTLLTAVIQSSSASVGILQALALTGCGYNEVDTNNCLNNADDALMKAEYEGHSYIIYKGSQKGGIIHDPDCPCHKK